MTVKKLAAVIMAILFSVVLASCSSSKGDGLAQEGESLYANGNYSEALEKYLSAEECGVDDFEKEKLCSCIGNCYFKLGDYENSIEYHLKSLEEDPEYFDGWVNLGVAYRQSGDNDRAMSCYETALNYDPENGASVQLYVSLGALYIELGKPISAIKYLEKASTVSDGVPEVYAYLSIAYAMALEPESSEEAFDKAQALGYPDMDEIREQIDKVGGE